MTKAYKISCSDDDHGATILFAKRGKDIRHRRPNEDCDCDFIERSVRRAPEFDKYAPGPVTIEQYLAEGWYWTCHGCDRLVYADDSPIIIGDGCYCDVDCVVRARKVWPEGVSGYHESVQKFCDEIDRWLATQDPIDKAIFGTTGN